MIPLAQFLNDKVSDDEFVPLRASLMRRATRPSAPDFADLTDEAEEDPLVQHLQSASRKMRQASVEMPNRAVPAPASANRPAPLASRPMAGSRPVAGVPAAAAIRPVTEPRVPLRELTAEREAWAAEREALLAERDEAVAEAREIGFAEGGDQVRQDLERVSEERLEDLRRTLLEDHDNALAQSRREWVEEEGERLADLLILQMAVFENAMRSALTALLRPLVVDARKRVTVDELAGAVKTIAFDGNAMKISASGPSDLLTALESKLGDHARHVAFDADDNQMDVRIDANQTVIESRLSSWMQAVEEALS